MYGWVRKKEETWWGICWISTRRHAIKMFKITTEFEVYIISIKKTHYNHFMLILN